MSSNDHNSTSEPTGWSLESLLENAQRLTSALLSDILDSVGAGGAFMGHTIRPLLPGMRVAGRAFTLAYTPMDQYPERPYENLFEAARHFQPGDVIVIASGDVRSGLWGGLLSTAAVARGVRGVVTDGLVRDVDEIQRLSFPVFARGATPLESAGRQEPIEFGSRISVAGVSVSPGDLIFGDSMGVVVVASEVARQVLPKAVDKGVGESRVREELARGEDLGDVFERFGIM